MGRVNTRTATDIQTNATATALIAAPGPNQRWHVSRIMGSVSSGAAIVQLMAGATVIWQGAATAGAPISEAFDPPIDVPANTAVSCVTAAAGAGIGGTANIQAYLGS